MRYLPLVFLLAGCSSVSGPRTLWDWRLVRDTLSNSINNVVAVFLQPASQGLVVDPEFVGDISHASSKPPNGVNSGASGVSVLHGSRGPSNISRFVPSVIVNAVNAMGSGRFLTNMVKERLKAVYPFGGNCNTAPSVIQKLRVFWVKAPTFEQNPSVVRRGFGLTVRAVSTPYGLVVKAPARLSVPAHDSACWRFMLFAAVAQKQPHEVPLLSFFSAAYRGKPIEFLTSKVKRFAHSALLNVAHRGRVWRAPVQTLFGSYPSQTGAS